MSTENNQTVVSCYDFLHLSPTTGEIGDFTEGIYEGNPERDYLKAQKLQRDYLLDEIGCVEGDTVLDIGFGYGNLLKDVKERGAKGIGISISEPQVSLGIGEGLDVRLINYRDIPEFWNDRFDGVVANGSIEHFVQPEDALGGKQDEIYREMFDIVHRILKPGTNFATTVIHYPSEERRPRPEEVLKSPSSLPRKSNDFYFSMLNNGFGLYYPVPGQLERCAEGFFNLKREVDGTEDYRITSEFWRDELKRNAFNPMFLMGLVDKAIQRPSHTWTMLNGLINHQYWVWQFRGEDPPTRLLRHTWERVN